MDTTSRSRSALTTTAIYYVSFIGLGMGAAVLGPSLLNLAEQTHVQLKQASILFTAMSLGYLVGALTSGRLFDRRRGHPIIAIALLAMAGLMALVPAVPRLELLALAVLLLGCAQAFVDIGNNTLIVWLHRTRVGPFMNGLHLFWGLGAFISPILIAQAILHTGSYAWAYWLMAVLLLPISLLFRSVASPGAPHHEPGSVPAKKPGWQIIGLFVLCYLTFVGAEAAYGDWIYSYAIATRIAGPAVAAYLTSAYWGALTLSRLVSIPLAVRFRSSTLLIINLAGCLLGLGLAILGGSSAVMIWIATIIFGASVATMFPVAISFANSFLTVTGQFTGWLFVGGSLGGMLIPWLIGQFFEPVGPHTMMVVLFIDMLICVGFFVLLSRKKLA